MLIVSIKVVYQYALHRKYVNGIGVKGFHIIIISAEKMRCGGVYELYFLFN